MKPGETLEKDETEKSDQIEATNKKVNEAEEYKKIVESITSKDKNEGKYFNFF